MTPACCNCLYYRMEFLECRNPASEHYNHYRRPGRCCVMWEDEKEFGDRNLYGLRLKTEERNDGKGILA